MDRPVNPGVTGELYALPVSYAQQRLWFLHRLEPDSPAYNMPAAFRLSGTLDIGALAQSFQTIGQRHETLRTTFSFVDGEPRQIVAPAPPAMTVRDLRNLDGWERETEVRRRLEEESGFCFDLEKGPLLRISLLRIDEAEAVLIINMHHIVSDGWSMPIFFREIAACYEAFSRKAPLDLPELPIQYADYAIWQRESLQGTPFEAQLSFWKDQLSGAPELQLPTDRPRSTATSGRGEKHSMTLPADTAARLKSLGRQEGVTPFMTLLAAFNTLLFRLTGQDDISVGTPIAGRTRPETEALIGFLVNTLVLRTDLSGEPTFRDLLARVRKVALDAYEHQDLPFERLVQEFNPDRLLGQTPLFQTMFTFRGPSESMLSLPGITVAQIETNLERAKFDLSALVAEKGDELAVTFNFNSDLFDGATIRRWLKYFQSLCASIAANPDQRLHRLVMLSDAELRQLLVDWNNSSRDYPRDACIHRIFEAQARATPAAVAVSSEDGEMTYAELNQRANRLARHLRKVGIGGDRLIGICTDRTPEMVVGLLAILKSGGAYVPLDPGYPRERLAFMLEDMRAAVLITEEGFLNRLPELAARVVCLDRDHLEIAGQSGEDLDGDGSADDLAYIIYTSGSTGNPKGVAVPHRAVNRLVLHTDYVDITTADVIAQVSNISFDAATFEIWGALLNGARLCVISTNTLLAPQELSRAIERHGLTTIFLTTALFNQFVQQIPAALGRLHNLLFGGEAVDAGSVGELLEKGRPKRLLHVYGPTETTTFASWYRVEGVSKNATIVPIGRPIANTEIYILDPHMNPVPAGVVGEIHIGGDGLARGYWNRPDLTGERFIANPFSAGAANRLYKTGDRARYRSDGEIEFIGRLDDQVKIRGHRIEPGEIASVLSQCRGVQECIVAVRSAAYGQKELAAYVIAAQDAGLTSNDLRVFLRAKLPDYMIPAGFLFLERFPLTPNGKINRKALPAPEHQERGESFREPRGPMEIALAHIWSELLGVSLIGRNDNFFDLGGHSLLATELLARVDAELGADLPLRVLFEGPTIEQLAPRIHAHKQASIFQLTQRGKYKHVFELQAADGRPPVFCFPFRGGIECEFFNFTRVARHFSGQYAFYGLLARGLDGVSEPHRAVGEMAADYIKEIRSVQPRGPYIFVGECQGGFVAYEAARQIMASGGEMGLLVLLDTHASLPAKGFLRRCAAPLKYHLGNSPAWKYFRDRYEYHNHAVREQGATAALGYSLTKIGSAVSTIPFLLRLEHSEGPRNATTEKERVSLRLARLRRAFDLAIRTYELPRYTGTVSLMINEQSHARNRMLDWTDYIAGGPEVYKLPGNHDACVPQNIPLVAQILRECFTGVARKS